MKFQLTFKTPNVTDQVDMDDEDVQKVIKKYVEWSEYITVEFDTETQTASVVP